MQALFQSGIIQFRQVRWEQNPWDILTEFVNTDVLLRCGTVDSTSLLYPCTSAGDFKGNAMELIVLFELPPRVEDKELLISKAVKLRSS